MTCYPDVCSIVPLHALRPVVVDGAELLKVWTTVVKEETGDIARAMAAVGAECHGPAARALTRGLGPTGFRIVEKLIGIQRIRQSRG